MQSYFDMTREELSAEQENLMKKYKDHGGLAGSCFDVIYLSC